MALKVDPVPFLAGFGKVPTLSEDQMSMCEAYLVQVLKNGSKSNTMDGLRIESYFHGNKSRSDLPPTSHATTLHIKRALFAAYDMMSILDTEKDSLDPTDYGFTKIEDKLVPDPGQNPIPHYFSVCCKCGRCSTEMCACLREGTECCRFCSCNSVGRECLNPITLRK